MDVHVPTVHGERLMDLEEISSEITSGSSQVMAGALRMARALEHARVTAGFSESDPHRIMQHERVR